MSDALDFAKLIINAPIAGASGYVTFKYPATLTPQQALALQSQAGYIPAGYGFSAFAATETETTWKCSNSCE